LRGYELACAPDLPGMSDNPLPRKSAVGDRRWSHAISRCAASVRAASRLPSAPLRKRSRFRLPRVPGACPNLSSARRSTAIQAGHDVAVPATTICRESASAGNRRGLPGQNKSGILRRCAGDPSVRHPCRGDSRGPASSPHGDDMQLSGSVRAFSRDLDKHKQSRLGSAPIQSFDESLDHAVLDPLKERSCLQTVR
jgi:hypothetical protein